MARPSRSRALGNRNDEDVGFRAVMCVKAQKIAGQQRQCARAGLLEPFPGKYFRDDRAPEKRKLIRSSCGWLRPSRAVCCFNGEDAELLALRVPFKCALCRSVNFMGSVRLSPIR
jgi:hypothetical protein